MNYPAIYNATTNRQPANVDGIVKKLVIGGVGLTAGYFAARGIYRLIKGPAGRDELKYQKSELTELNRNPSTRQKLSQSQIETYANGIFTAADGYQTDEEYIYKVFRQIKTNADYLALNKAFGLREISSGTWNPEANYKGNLTGVLVSELDEDELAKVNTILKNNRIKYRI